jgi:hypothetical protein
MSRGGWRTNTPPPAKTRAGRVRRSSSESMRRDEFARLAAARRDRERLRAAAPPRRSSDGD